MIPLSISIFSGNGFTVSIGRMSVFFSYRMPIAYREYKNDDDNKIIVISENVYGPPSQKHFDILQDNYICQEVNNQSFKQMIKTAIEKTIIDMASTTILQKMKIKEQQDVQITRE